MSAPDTPSHDKLIATEQIPSPALLNPAAAGFIAGTFGGILSINLKDSTDID